ncbi:MAG: hypothetical protein H6727_20240, partial [Myxococcales bacterium]|nr:hypothetical protein [Myxococcales bacterium]
MLHSKIQIQLEQHTPRRQRSPRKRGERGERGGSPRSRRRRHWSPEESQPAQTGLDLLTRIAQAYASAGIDNAIALEIDQSPIYLDTEEREHDLDDMMRAAQSSNVLQKPFGNMHILLSHEEEGLRILFDIRADQDALAGEAPIQTDVSARLLQLQIQRGEDARNYSERLRAFAADPSKLDWSRQALESITQRVASHLRDTLPEAEIHHEPVTVRLQKLTPQQIGNFRNLSFGEGAQVPRMRSMQSSAPQRSHSFTRYAAPPPAHRRGARREDDREEERPRGRRRRREERESPRAGRRRRRHQRQNRRPLHRQPLYVDVYDVYYYDPYYDFMLYSFFSCMLYDHYWHLPYVYILDPWGYALGSAFYAEDFLIHDPWFHDGFIDYGYGGLYVNDAIPYVDAYDHGYFGEYDGFADDFYHGIAEGAYDDYGYSADYDHGWGDDDYGGYDDGYDDRGGYDDAGHDDDRFDDQDDFHDAGYDDRGGYDDNDDRGGGWDDGGGGWDDGGGWDSGGGWDGGGGGWDGGGGGW